MKSRTYRGNIVRFCLLWTLFIAWGSAIASPKTLPRLPIWPTFDYGLGESLGKREIQKQGPTDELFLWRVDGEYSTVYLMGSIHVLKKSSYPLADLYEYVYDECDQLVVEHYEPDEEQDAQNQLSKAFLSDGKTLSQYITSSTYKWIRDFAIDNDLPANVFDIYIPEFVYLNILYMKAENYGFDPSLGVDFHFIDKAEADSKRIYSLEGAERYDKIFSGSISKQAKKLEGFIAEIKKGNVERSLNELVDAWINNKHDELEAALLKNKKDDPAEYNSSLRDRNVAWIPNIEKYFNQNKVTLVVAGTFHFFGEHSVLKLLEAKGYKIKQLYNVEVPSISFESAIDNGNLKIMNEYLPFHPNLNLTLKGYENWGPMHEASSKGTIDSVKFLIGNGAKVDVTNQKGYTPLHLASLLGRFNIVELLIENGADVNTEDNILNTPLHNTAQLEEIQMMQLLIENGANIDIRNKEDGWTPLHNAAAGGKVESIELLLQNGAEINAKSFIGESPLHFAASRGHKKAVESLVTNGASIFIKTDTGKTAYELSVDNNHSKIAEYLKNANRPPEIILQPLSKTFLLGETIEISVESLGFNLKYQWYKDGNMLDGVSGSDINFINGLETSDAGEYYVTVSNQFGSVTSRMAILTYKDQRLLWEFKTGDSVHSSPAIDSNGTVYVGSWDNSLYAINPDGSNKWEFVTGDSVHSSPAIASDGTIYIGSRDGNLYAINPDGSKKWEFKTGDDVLSSPAIGNDGIIYVGSSDNNLYAINREGNKKWEFSTRDDVSSSPAIASDGTIYVGSRDGNLYAINPDGSKKWEFVTGINVRSSPAIGIYGTIYVGSDDNRLYAISPNGFKKWEFSTRNDVSSSPAIASDGTIYIGSRDGNLYAINPDGSKKWEFVTGRIVSSSPAIGSDGTVYVGSLCAINPDGSKKWEFEAGGWGYSWVPPVVNSHYASPVIGSDGTVYIGSSDNHIYALKTSSSGPADSPWPMFAQNTRRTSKAPRIIDPGPPDAPIITKQPKNISVYPNKHIAFSVEASGLYLKYHWHKDGAVLEGQTGFTLVILNVQPNDAGEYYVTVTNESGAATSQIALLSVNSLEKDETVKISAFKYSGEFQFDINGMKGATFLIEASTDLKLWHPIGEFKNSDGTVKFSDRTSPLSDQRFYRVKVVE